MNSKGTIVCLIAVVLHTGTRVRKCINCGLLFQTKYPCQDEEPLSPDELSKFCDGMYKSKEFEVCNKEFKRELRC